MEDPLWTATHAPALADLPQDGVRDRMDRALAEPVNLLVHGPAGAGKTAAVRALADELHDHEDDYIELNVSDFFDRTKTEIRNDPRFEGFLQGEIPWVRQLSSEQRQNRSKRYKSDWSKSEMVTHVLKEYATHAPASGEYKTVLLDNAEAMREDFQQALRRVMERHYETTQFVIATRQPSKLIPALRSRCFPVPVRAPTREEIQGVLADIAAAEDVPHDDEGLGYVAAYADGDLRRAILAAQTAAVETGGIEGGGVLDPLREVGPREAVEGMLADAEDGAFADARSTLDDLLVDRGYSGEEVLAAIREAAARRYGDRRLAAVHELAGEVDLDLARGTNERLHLARLLAELAADAVAGADRQ
ncbi:MAG: AAA family ATPase [Halobacteriaceae archaeon]